MNSLSLKNVSLLLGITVTIASNSLPVGAETPLKQSELASTPVLEVAPATTTAANPVVNNSTTSLVAPNATGAAIIKQLDNTPISNTVVEIPIPPAALAQTQSEPQASLDAPVSNTVVEIPVPPAALAQTQSEPEVAVTPPEKLETSAAYLAAQPNSSFGSTVPVQESNTAVAQNTEIIPGRATRGGSSYIGIGGNLGLGGGAALGDGAFMINSKIGLTRNISFRPAVLFADDVDFLLPVTYDFVLESADPFAPIPFAPYVGGGVIVSTNGDNTLGFLLTGGVDVPLSAQFVANAAISVGFRDDTDVGLMLGVGYTFPGFSR